MKLLSLYNHLVILVIQSIITSQSFHVVCYIHLGLPYQLIVSCSLMFLPVLGPVYMQCSPFSLDVPSPRIIFSFFYNHFFMLSVHCKTILYLQRALHFLQPRRWCTVVYAPYITCICHIPLFPWAFSTIIRWSSLFLISFVTHSKPVLHWFYLPVCIQKFEDLIFVQVKQIHFFFQNRQSFFDHSTLSKNNFCTFLYRFL